MSTIKTTDPLYEAERLKRLRSLNILHSERERAYEDIARLAAEICQTPIAGIGFVDETTLWIKAEVGMHIREVAREHACCSMTIEGPHPLQISNLAEHPRTRCNPLVEGAGMRAYLGVPLTDRDGYALGALCVFDRQPRNFSPSQVAAMESLARQVMTQLELQQTNVELQAERSRYHDLVHSLRDVVFQADIAGRFTYLNPAWSRIMGEELQGCPSLFDQMIDEDRSNVARQLVSLQERRRDFISLLARFKGAGGEEKVLELFLHLGPPDATGRPTLIGTIADRTLLSKSHRRLFEREAVLNSFFNASPYMMGIVEVSDQEIIHLTDNPSARKFFGREEAQAYPVSASALGVPLEIQAFWLAKYRECRERQEPVRFEYRHETPTGSPQWLDCTINYITRSPQGVPRFSFTVSDVTEARLAHEELLKGRALLETVTSHLGDVIWMSDAEKQSMVYISEAYETVWGHSRKSLIENPISFIDAIHPDDRARVIAAMPKQHQGTYDEIYRIVTPEGKQKWVHDRAYPVRSDGGTSLRVVGIAADVTALREEEERSERARKNLELVLNNLPLSVSLFDPGGKHEWVNQEWVNCFGWTPEEAIGKGLFCGDENLAQMTAHMESGESWKEFEIKTKHGVKKLVSVAVVRLPSKQKVCIIRDLTNEKAQERVIADQQQRIVESARFSSLGEMAASIAHEINNPLAIIQGSAQVIASLLEREAVDRQKLNHSLTRIDSTVTRIAKIISGLKSFARDGSKDPHLPTSLQTIVQEALELCQARFKHHGVNLTVNLPAQDVVVAARSVQLSQVLLNLLNNAFDAVLPQQLREVRVELEEKPDGVYLRVFDSGPGVHPLLRDKVMQPFFTTKPPGKGTGIGLSLSRAFVQDHGGELALLHDSDTTCFEIRLPKMRSQGRAA